MESSEYIKRQEQVRNFNANNRWKKRGIALIPTKFGMSFTIKSLNQVHLPLFPLPHAISLSLTLLLIGCQAGALVHVYTDGTVLVTHGGTEMGQGLHTKMAQIAAKVLSPSLFIFLFHLFLFFVLCFISFCYPVSLLVLTSFPRHSEFQYPVFT